MPRTSLLEADGNELQALLAPITPQAFVHDYWSRKPLFVKGFQGKYEGFFDAETFQAGACFARAVSRGFPACQLRHQDGIR